MGLRLRGSLWGRVLKAHCEAEALCEAAGSCEAEALYRDEAKRLFMVLSLEGSLWG